METSDSYVYVGDDAFETSQIQSARTRRFHENEKRRLAMRRCLKITAAIRVHDSAAADRYFEGFERRYLIEQRYL